MVNHFVFLGLLNKEVKKHGSQRAASAALGVSPQYLGDVLAGKREPGKKIVSALGYRRILCYEKVPV